MKISVALASYNGERYLAKQLDSIARQSHTPFEIVISDDASTDKTMSILDNFQQHTSIPTTILKATSPKGINANFTKAFLACRGDYIAAADQDDIWPPEKLAAFIDKLKTQPLIVYGPSSIITENDTRIGQDTSEYIGFAEYQHGRLPLYFVFGNCISGHAMLFSRQLLAQALPFPKHSLYDHWLALCAAVQEEIIFAKNANTLHRIHRGNSINQRELKKRAKKTAPKRSKHARFLAARATLLERIDKAQQLGTILSEKDNKVLADLKHCLRRSNNQFFNAQLFFLLYSYCEEMFGRKNVNECYKRAFGGRWFSFLDRILGRHKE